MSEIPGTTYTQELSRSLTLLDNVMITLSSVSPASSVFIITPTLILGLAGGSVLAMVIGAVIGIFVAVCYGEVASAYPLTGGEYTWAARLLGKPAGFAIFLLSLVSATLILSIFAVGMLSLLPVISSSLSATWLVFVILGITTVISCLTIKANAFVTGTCLALEVIAIATLVFLGFTHVERGPATLVSPQTLAGDGTLQTVTLGVLFSLVPVALFAFNGYGSAVYYAEETHNATKTIGRAILISLAVTVVVETLPVIAVVLGAPSLTDMLASGDPYGYFLSSLAGSTVTKLVLIGIIIAVFNAIIAVEIAAGRLLYASARDRSWPDAIDRLLSGVSTRTRTPVAATLVIGVLAMLMAYFVPFDWLITATGSSIVFVYAAVALSALRVRSNGRQGDDIYRMPWFPVPPLVVLAFMAYVLYQAATTDASPVLAALIILGLGAAWYLLFIRNARGERWTLPDPQDDGLAERVPTAEFP